MNLAIVGSRTNTDYDAFCTTVNNYIDKNGTPRVIVSGGAKGVDALAARFAREHGIALVEYHADWRAHGRAAGPMRNTQIVDAATHMLAFPSRAGRGTQDSIRKARKKLGDLRVQVVYID